jgi:hypothetical protein
VGVTDARRSTKTGRIPVGGLTFSNIAPCLNNSITALLIFQLSKVKERRFQHGGSLNHQKKLVVLRIFAYDC